MLELSESKVYQFEEFRLDAKSHRLFRRESGELVPLTPKAIELLLVLVQSKGRILTKNELLELVWSGSFVEESNLSQTIFVLRKALGESTKEPRFILTVPNRGYQFIAQVTEIGTEDEILKESFLSDVCQLEIQQQRTKDKRQTRDFIWLAAAPFVLLLIFGIYWFYPQSKPEILRDVKSIAVLPLKSFAEAGVDESLRMRITDALITRLGNSKRIAVRPTSAILPFVNAEQDAIEIGRELQVDAILDGRIQQENEKVRVTLQLISVRDNRQMWADQFDGQTNQILNLQDKIYAKTERLLDIGDQNLLPDKPLTESAEAYEAYLKGRYFWNKRNKQSLYKAIEYFNQAVALDSQFAEAYVGLADAYYVLFGYDLEIAPQNVVQAKENLARAFSLKPNSAEALTTLGYIQTTFDWDWTNAEQSLKQAIEIAPNSALAHMRYAMLLVRLRRFDEAHSEIEKAIKLDPLSLDINTNFGVLYFCKKDYLAAERQLRKTLEIDDSYSAAHWWLSHCLWQAGKRDESIKEIIRGLNTEGRELLSQKLEARTRVGNSSDVIRELLVEWQVDRIDYNPHNFARYSINLNDREKALFWLEQSYRERHPWTSWINAVPEFDGLRGEPRFEELLKKMNLR